MLAKGTCEAYFIQGCIIRLSSCPGNLSAPTCTTSYCSRFREFNQQIPYLAKVAEWFATDVWVGLVVAESTKRTVLKHAGK